MRSDFKLQKLFLLLILSFSTLSGCIGLPSESDPSPTPETPVSNEQPQASGAEGSNPPDATPTPLSTQAPSPLMTKWDEFVESIKTNVIDESSLAEVKNKATELKNLPGVPDEIKAFLEIVIQYDGLADEDESPDLTFSSELVKGDLITDFQIDDGNATELLNPENKQDTAQRISESLNNKYRSLLVSSPPAQPSTSSTQPALQIIDPHSEVKTQWNNFLLALKKNITNGSRDNFQKVKEEAEQLNDVSGNPRRFLNAVINYPSEDDLSYHNFNNDLVETGLGIKDLAIGDPELLLSSGSLNSENTAIRITDILNYKYRSELISYPGQENSDNSLRVIAFGILIVALMAGIIKLNMFSIKLYRYREKLNISLDFNNWSSSSHNVGTSTKPPIRKSLYPARTSVTNVTWSDIDSKEQNQQIVSLEQTVQEQNQQIVSLEQTVQEQNRQIVSLEQTVQMLEQQIKTLKQEPIATSVSYSPSQSQNIYKQMISQSTPVEDKNISSRRMGSGEYPFFVSTKKQAHLGIYQDPSGEDFLLPTKPKTNHERLSSYFDLQGSSKDGVVEVIEPAIVILSGQGWELYQKGIVEFR